MLLIKGSDNITIILAIYWVIYIRGKLTEAQISDNSERYPWKYTNLRTYPGLQKIWFKISE